MRSVKFYLFGLFCITLIALGIFVLILLNTDPYSADILTIIVFYISLYIFNVGILTFIGFYLRVARSNNGLFYLNFKPALRQATLISLIFVSLLVLKMMKVLNWWDAVMLSLAILLFEMYFQTRNMKIKQSD